MAFQFNAPNKTTVIADGEDAVIWEHLPNPTLFVCHQKGNDAYVAGEGRDRRIVPEKRNTASEWVVTEGNFVATFNPAGTYFFVLSADGYQTMFCEIKAE